jgi:rhodanese-related sulfurtransferase
VREISVAEFKALRDEARDYVLLDVREPSEIELAQIPGSLNIPLAQVAGRLADVPRDRDLVVMCHGGVRSARAVKYLEQNGYDRAFNLDGGIDAWSREIDPEVPTY